jgi:hypothetical protein
MHFFTFINNTTCYMIISPPLPPPRAARVTLALQGDQVTHTHTLHPPPLLLGRKTSILQPLPRKSMKQMPSTTTSYKQWLTTGTLNT